MVIVTFLAIQIGFGAVLLTRAGRRRERWNTPYDADAAWQAAMDIDVEPDAEAESADSATGDATEQEDGSDA